MDDAESLVPSKKSKIDTNYSLYIICQKDLNKPVIKRPSLQTIKNVIYLSNERSNCGDSSVNDFVKRVNKNRKLILVMLKREIVLCYDTKKRLPKSPLK